jgi:hypothetical protein
VRIISLGLLVGLLFAGLLGCEHQVTGYPPQPEQTHPADRDRVIVYIHWTEDVDEIARQCARPHALTYGCEVPTQLGPSDWKCDVYVQQPRDFNDVPRLAVLGHETLHCFGALHKEP